MPSPAATPAKEKRTGDELVWDWLKIHGYERQQEGGPTNFELLGWSEEPRGNGKDTWGADDLGLEEKVEREALAIAEPENEYEDVNAYAAVVAPAIPADAVDARLVHLNGTISIPQKTGHGTRVTGWEADDPVICIVNGCGRPYVNASGVRAHMLSEHGYARGTTGKLWRESELLAEGVVVRRA